jgi:hypothetical protein
MRVRRNLIRQALTVAQLHMGVAVKLPHHCFNFLVPSFCAVHSAAEVLLKPPAAAYHNSDVILLKQRQFRVLDRLIGQPPDPLTSTGATNAAAHSDRATNCLRLVQSSKRSAVNGNKISNVVHNMLHRLQPAQRSTVGQDFMAAAPEDAGVYSTAHVEASSFRSPGQG